jgi:hypothetical protein
MEWLLGRSAAASSNVGTSERVMSAIKPFVKDPSAFEPNVTGAMSAAFEDVCRALALKNDATASDALARESIAAQIIALARDGVHDSTQLRDIVLHEATQAKSA